MNLSQYVQVEQSRALCEARMAEAQRSRELKQAKLEQRQSARPASNQKRVQVNTGALNPVSR